MIGSGMQNFLQKSNHDKKESMKIIYIFSANHNFTITFHLRTFYWSIFSTTKRSLVQQHLNGAGKSYPYAYPSQWGGHAQTHIALNLFHELQSQVWNFR